MKCYFLFLFLLFSGSLFSQELEALIKACKTENTARSWNELAYYYYNSGSDTDLIRSSAEKAYAHAIEENNKEDIGSSLTLLAEINYAYSSEWNKYIGQLEEAFEYLKQTENFREQSEVINNMGYAYNNIGRYNDAIQCFRQAIALCLKADGGDKEVAPMYINIAFAHLYQGQLDSTLHYVAEAREVAEIAKDTIVLIECHNHLGIIHRRNGNFAAAIEAFEKSLQLYELMGNNNKVSITLMNIATLYFDWKKPNEALYFARKAVAHAYDYPNEAHNLGRSLAGLGTILFQNKQFESSIDTLRLAIPFLKESKSESYINYVNMASTYFSLNQIDSTEVYLVKAETYLKENKDLPAHFYYKAKGSLLAKKGEYKEAIPLLEAYISHLRNQKQIFAYGNYDLYNALAISYEKGLGNYQKALFYKNMAYDYQDSLYREEHNRVINDFLIKYQTAEKDLEIIRLDHLQQELRYNRTLMAGVFIAIAFLLLFAWLYNRLLRIRREKETVELNRRIKEKDQEYQLLVNDSEIKQMQHYLTGLEAERTRLAKDLHDHVSNSLFILDMELQSNPSVSESIHLRMEELYTQVRNISHDLMPPAFQYASLYQTLSAYFMTLNEQSIAHFELAIDEEVEENIGQNIAFELYRIVQETTSNIIKHSKATAAKITLELKEPHKLKLSIEDNGIGFDSSKMKQGIGLQIIKDRCKIMNASLTINSSSEQGCSIEIIIPLNQPNAAE